MTIGLQNAMTVLHEYPMDHLGASFRVVLVDSVKEVTDETTGEKCVQIPDQQNLVKLIAATRAVDERKLSGPDIKFLRKTLGLKSCGLAEKLDVSPEYLSRCEAGAKTLSSNSEKILRLMVLLAPFYVSETAVENASEEMKRVLELKMCRIAEVAQVVNDMKLVPVFDIACPIIYTFSYAKKPFVNFFNSVSPANDDDGEWCMKVVNC